jgi:Thermolysin metallopeptidase, alpha-helical domain/Caspase domain/Thermolysin metallopeptidase, catalytic domain/Papain family cysteine protease
VAEARYALLLGTSSYKDPTLHALTAPANDAKDLKAVLADSKIGAFNTATHINKSSYVLQEAIERFFAERDPDDTALLFFSGHGVKDDAGNLYLAAKNTTRSLLRSTAIDNGFLQAVMNASRARRQVLILDCCFGGAFAKGFKGDDSVDVNTFFQGRGRAILTASNAVQFSFEGDDAEPAQRRSVFTQTIVEGLRTGEADIDRDQQISIQDLYDYAYKRVTLVETRQTPTISTVGQEGSIFIASVPRTAARPANVTPLSPTTVDAGALDLRPWVRIRDQGPEGSNPAVAAVTALETFLSARGSATQLSPRYVYQKAKQLQKAPQESDAGMQMDVLAKVLEDYGAPPEESWPYEPGKWQLPKGKTWKRLDALAHPYRALLYPVTSWADFRFHLGRRRPILAAFKVYESTWMTPDVTKSGRIEKPAPNDQLLGAVATAIVGVDEAGTIIFAHTWGSDWGDSGFGSMSLEAAKATFNQDEMWAVEVRSQAGFTWVEPAAAPAPQVAEPAPDEPLPEPRPRRRRARTPSSGLRRVVYNAQNRAADWTQPKLPRSARARTEGDPATGDDAVDTAYDALGAFHRFFYEQYGRKSWDGRRGPLEAIVHYGRDYENGFWDGRRVILGDGDGARFRSFARLDVIAKECANGLLQSEWEFSYAGETGALVQSLGCVFASLVKQHELEQTAAKADWLIGSDLLGPDVRGRALFSLAKPGSAYDDSTLGKDTQVGHMSAFVKSDPRGVYINAGIPNHAFYLAAKRLRGNAWTRAGRVWYESLVRDSQSPKMTPRMTFKGFARRTVAVAKAVFPDDERVASAIEESWADVGVAG